MSSSENAELEVLVCALRVGLQAVFAKDGEYSENAGAISGHLRPYF
jgi:hypothetical protein